MTIIPSSAGAAASWDIRDFGALGVFLGSNFGNDPKFEATAKATGAVLAQRGIEIVFGGARPGLMGVLAGAALEEGGRVTGVLLGRLLDLAHEHLTELVLVNSVPERLQVIDQRVDGYLILPGGLGTFEELMGILVSRQLGFHAKPIGLLDVSEFFLPVTSLVDSLCVTGFIDDTDRGLFVVGEDLNDLLSSMKESRFTAGGKWRDRRTTN